MSDASNNTSKNDPAPASGQSEALDGRISGLFSRMSEGLELVDRAMREQLESATELMPSIGSHVLSSGGKRLRPILALLSSELCGYTGSRSVQLGAALNEAMARRAMPELPGHPQVHTEGRTAARNDRQLFAMPGQAIDAFALQEAGPPDTCLRAPASRVPASHDVRSRERDPPYYRAGQHRHQRLAEMIDLRKLRQRKPP